MSKCFLIYLWIYIGLFYLIEAGDDDEHVHIKLHMTSGQRKRAQIQQHTHQHHKKRHTNPHQYPRPHQQPSHPLPPPVATTNLYHDSPHNYLTGITATSSSSLLPQNHVFQSAHTKKFPSSSPLNLHESGQLLNIEEDVFGQGDVVGGDAAVVSVDTVDGEPMTIPSYLAKNFASFPQPTTTYETEIIPHNSEGFNVVGEVFDGLEDMDEDNEITAPVGRGKGSLESMLLENYQHHHHHHHHKPSLAATKSIKNAQLLQQLLQQQQSEQPEIINAAAYKSAKLRGNKYKTEKDYHSEDDMTEAMMYSSSVGGTRHNPDETTNSGSIKPLTVDDIWSQLQQQYLSKYSPQAQPLASADSDEQQSLAPTVAAYKTKPKRKRNTKRQRHAKPTTTTSYSTSWPAKTLTYAGNVHHSTHYIQPTIKQLQQQQHYYDDLHSPPSASAFSGISLSAHRDSDFFVKRPEFNKFNTHNDEEEIGETDEERVVEFGEGVDGDDDEEDDDDFDAFGDESFEEAVYQRGKKYTGRAAYGQKHGHTTSNLFKSHDLYGAFSTPVTATVTTDVQPSTYHPNLVASTLPSFTATSTNAFLPTSSHPSTSYQWRTQHNYPASYQTYHLQHQQSPQWTAEEQYAQQQSSALRLPKAAIIQTPNAIVSAKLSPTQSNHFTVPSSMSSFSSSTTASTSAAQTPARYKKRKNRIKPKRNRIVVI